MRFWAAVLLLLLVTFPRHQNALRTDCFKPLGMESGVIKDSQLSAGSSDSRYGPERGRLNNNYNVYNHAWCSDSEKPRTEYFQIDLQQIRHVSAIATQGTKTIWAQYYVKTYAVKYSFDGSTWYPYKEKVARRYKERIFDGNTNSDGVEKEEFNDDFVTRFLRIYPLTFKNDMCLRVELYGCQDSKDSCSKLIQLPSSGEIISPQHPSVYPPGMHCTWIIQGARQRVALISKFFDVGETVGSCRDNLKVLDGPHDWSAVLGNFCGGMHPTLLKSTNEFMRIQFHSSPNSSPREGFQLQFIKFTPGTDEVFVGTACNGRHLNLNCPSMGSMKAIKLIHSFFGAYPFASDCGVQVSNTTCQTSDVEEQIVSYCQDYKQCDILVDQSLFGHSTCGNTVTQRLDVYYQCTSTNIKTVPPTPMTTTAAPAPAPDMPTTWKPITSAPDVPTTWKPITSAPDVPTTWKPITLAPTTRAPVVNTSASSPAPNVSTTSPPIKSTQTTVVKSEAGVVEETGTKPTVTGNLTTSAIMDSVQARRGGGMSTGSLAAVVVVAVLLVIGVLLAVVLYVVCRRRFRKKSNHASPVRYSRPSLKRGKDKERCNTDPDGRLYDSVNILYDSADGKPSQLQAAEHIYESAQAVGMTENPLYVRSTPESDGYEMIRPPKRPPVMAHMYEQPTEPQRPHTKSVSNPNYDKTLTVKTLVEDV